MDEETLDTIAKVCELVVDAGVHKEESIKVAEAAKVIENRQRDINIAFMNELSIIFNIYIMKEMQKSGIGERTAQTAKKELGVLSYRKQESWYWHLPEPDMRAGEADV